jgi:hypothetical protein
VNFTGLSLLPQLPRFAGSPLYRVGDLLQFSHIPIMLDVAEMAGFIGK